MGEIGSWVRTGVVVVGAVWALNSVVLPWIDNNTGDAAKVAAATAGAYGAAKGAASRIGGGGGGAGGGGDGGSPSKEKDKKPVATPVATPAPATTTTTEKGKVITRPQVQLAPPEDTLPQVLFFPQLDG